jgi:hypothetical protein
MDKSQLIQKIEEMDRIIHNSKNLLHIENSIALKKIYKGKYRELTGEDYKENE